MSSAVNLHPPFREQPSTLSLLRRVIGAGNFEGGFGGSCLDCPFADGPFGDKFGGDHDWIHNSDHTEAYFRCNLPTRPDRGYEWGEYAPCTPDEWWDGVLAARALPAPEAPDA